MFGCGGGGGGGRRARARRSGIYYSFSLFVWPYPKCARNNVIII